MRKYLALLAIPAVLAMAGCSREVHGPIKLAYRQYLGDYYCRFGKWPESQDELVRSLPKDNRDFLDQEDRYFNVAASFTVKDRVLHVVLTARDGLRSAFRMSPSEQECPSGKRGYQSE